MERSSPGGFVTTAFGNDFAIAQYNMDGTLDTNFGAGGKIRTIFGSHNYGGPITTQPDGKIVVAGADDLGPTYDFVVGRFNADGTMDTTFGTNGIVLTPFGGDNWINGVAIQADGKIVAVGYADVASGDDFALARYDSDLPFVSEIKLDPPTVPVGTSFTATFSGTNLSGETYFDIRFRAPGNSAEDVILNWQQGKSAVHAVQSDTATGAWTLTGVRAHQEIDTHDGDFVSGPATLTVTPSR